MHVYLCLGLFTPECLPLLLMFTRVYLCVHLFTYVYTCLPTLSLFTLVYNCLPMFTTVYSFFTLDYSYLTMFTLFSPMHTPCILFFTYVTRVYLSLLVFTYVKYCLQVHIYLFLLLFTLFYLRLLVTRNS